MKQSSASSNRTRSAGAGVRCLCVPVALVVGTLAISTAAWAQPTVVNTVNDPEGDSGFTLTFPDLGITTSSSVINTNIEIEIDEEAGTARFLKYSQSVEPLLLPGPDGDMISTGDITIRVLSSDGTFDSASQTFTTNDVFEISFTNDLSAFALTSPTQLPATSQGTVTPGPRSARRIDMVWEGSGQLGDPAQPLRFTYVSRNFTIIDPLPLLTALQACGSDVCGAGGMGMMSLMLLGLWLMKMGVRRRRR